MEKVERQLKISSYINYIIDYNIRNLYLYMEKDIRDKMLMMPASTKYHHCWVGGLYDHTQEVIEQAFYLHSTDNTVNKLMSKDDIIISAFVHDLDKLNKYQIDPNNPSAFTYVERMSIAATTRTVSLLSDYGIALTDLQLNALTFAEGGWSSEARTNTNSKLEPLAVIINIADMYSTYFRGKR